MNKIVHPVLHAHRRVPPFWPVSHTSAHASLEQLFKTHRHGYRAGALIRPDFAAADVTYCILSGWVSLSKSMPDGQRQTIDFALPGDVLNQISAPIATGALVMETVTFATLAIIPRSVWTRACEHAPQIATLENQRATEMLARLSDRMLRLGKGSAETRIAYALIELWMRMRSIGQAHGLGFQLPLTQQQLGEFTGLSSVHVCRTLGRLSQGGLIAIQDHMNIRITNIDALAALAGVDTACLPEPCR